MTTANAPVRNVLLTCASDDAVGGVQVVVRDLTHWLEESGRHVHLIYPTPLPGVRLKERGNSWGRTAFYCPMPGLVRDNLAIALPVMLGYLPIACLQIARLIRRKRIDVINCHYLTPYFVHLAVAARLLRVPLVLSVHGADIDTVAEAGAVERRVARFIVGSATRVIACSHALARRTTEVFPESADRIGWIHNGFEPSRYVVDDRESTVTSPFVLAVCRHVRKKGIDTLLHAFAQMLRAFPNLSLVLIGDGPLLAEHRRLAASLAIDHRVIFTGAVPHSQVALFFSRCSVFALPSRSEPFGMVVLEAAYYRKPTVCTRVGGVPEIISHGVNGLLVEPDDPGAMAQQIVELLRHPERAAVLGRNAHQTLLSRFMWRDRIRDYIAAFEGRPGAPADVPAGPGPDGAGEKRLASAPAM